MFIGYLAEKRVVAVAARMAGMGRESAYRLRARPGAAGFAAAWDAALWRPGLPLPERVDLRSAKATGLAAGYRAEAGLLRVVMRNGRFVRVARIADDSALLAHLAQLDRHVRLEGLER